MTTTSYTPRSQQSAPSYSGRIIVKSEYEGRKNADDLGIGLDYDNALMQDENGVYVVFHTGLFSESETEFQPRPTVNP